MIENETAGHMDLPPPASHPPHPAAAAAYPTHHPDPGEDTSTGLHIHGDMHSPASSFRTELPLGVVLGTSSKCKLEKIKEMTN